MTVPQQRPGGVHAGASPSPASPPQQGTTRRRTTSTPPTQTTTPPTQLRTHRSGKLSLLINTARRSRVFAFFGAFFSKMFAVIWS